MNKTETHKLLSLIKGYYNSQFFVDDYVLEAWFTQLQPYELEDAKAHIQKYIKENPDIAPKPHTFTRGLLTKREKEEIRNSQYTVECNLCHQFMSMQRYEDHYFGCLMRLRNARETQ